MKPEFRFLAIPAIVLTVPASGWAVTYLSVGQAQQLIFPGASFTSRPLELSGEQRKAIEKKSGIRVRLKKQPIWKVSQGGWFILDEVLGKHEFITYAVGLNADGSVRQIEILDYRETYGHEIRNKAWRQQFVGKTSASALKLDRDIKNISGATLSCRHIADGVKRLLALYDICLK